MPERGAGRPRGATQQQPRQTPPRPAAVDSGEEDDSGQDDIPQLDGDNNPAEVQAALGNVATGLAEQLSSITEEMNKIRQELYGENGIGGIAKDLEKLKSGGLEGLLENAGLDGLGDLGGLGLGGGAGGGSSSSAGQRGGGGGASRASAAAAAAGAGSGLGGGGEGVARSPKGAGGKGASVAEQLAGLDGPSREAFARAASAAERARRRKQEATETKGAGFGEKLLLFLVVLVCLYVGSPFFQMMVRRCFSLLVYGEVNLAEFEGAGGDDDGAIEPDL